MFPSRATRYLPDKQLDSMERSARSETLTWPRSFGSLACRHSVTEAAFASGLHHLGRVSAEYRPQFGELPSETLARSIIVS